MAQGGCCRNPFTNGSLDMGSGPWQRAPPGVCAGAERARPAHRTGLSGGHCDVGTGRRRMGSGPVSRVALPLKPPDSEVMKARRIVIRLSIPTIPTRDGEVEEAILTNLAKHT